MTTLTLVLFIMLLPLCLILIGLILLQGGAGDISSAFGGGGQLDSTLGVGAGRKMSKITGWLAGLFLVIVLILSVPNPNDLSKAAGAAKSVTPPIDATKPPALPIPPTTPVIEQPAVPAAPVLTPPAVTPGAPAASAPVVPPVVQESPAVVVPAAPAVVAPAAPAAVAPVVPAADAAVPAAPRSGITLDEPKK